MKKEEKKLNQINISKHGIKYWMRFENKNKLQLGISAAKEIVTNKQFKHYFKTSNNLNIKLYSKSLHKLEAYRAD